MRIELEDGEDHEVLVALRAAIKEGIRHTADQGYMAATDDYLEAYEAFIEAADVPDTLTADYVLRSIAEEREREHRQMEADLQA